MRTFVTLALTATLACLAIWQLSVLASGSGKPKPPAVSDLGPSARAMCKDFLSRSGYRATEWGNTWEWTTIDNKDGIWSVGARFMGAAPGGVTRNLYVTCVMSNSGDNWSVVSLSRM